MPMYCGLDLHARSTYYSILDEARKLISGGRLDNDLRVIIGALEPYREEIVGIAVESTNSWYWLVDGLMEVGYRLHLANTNKAQQYSGLRYIDDRHDAGWLALIGGRTLASAVRTLPSDDPMVPCSGTVTFLSATLVSVPVHELSWRCHSCA